MMKHYLCAALAGVWTLAASADTVSIRADEWFPMNGDPKANQPGYMIELAREIFEAEGHRVDYGIMPWERAVREVRSGNYDCVVGAYKEDAPDFIYPEHPWGKDISTFFVKQGDAWSYTGLESLAGETFGLIGGYAYGDPFGSYAETNKTSSMFQFINGNNALENNIRKVLAGRVTATVESPLVMGAKLKELGLKGQLREAGVIGTPTSMYIACSPAKPSSKEYVRLVDEGTRKLRESGKLAEILERYGLEDWQQ